MSSYVSVIILNAFSLKNLDDCLKSVVSTQYSPLEIIVVDCLTPGIEEFVSQRYPSVKLVKLDVDIGPSAMHNVAMDCANPSSEFFAFLDNDTIVDSQWLRELLICASTDCNLAAVQSLLLLHDSPDTVNTEGNMANYLAVGWPEGLGRHVTDMEASGDISFPSGAAMLVRREAIERVGRYDEDFFIYADDLDVGLRMRLAGFAMKSCHRSIVYHKYRFMRSKRSFYYLNRNRLLTFLKMYRKKTYIALIPATVLYEVFVLCYAVRYGLTPELFKAYADVLLQSREIKVKRIDVASFKVLSDREILTLLRGSIDFPEITGNSAVRCVLNPFLEGWRRLLAQSERIE